MKLEKRIHLLLALSFCLLVEGRGEVKKIEGLTFARYGNRELKLDLFKPAKKNKSLPAIVCIHGGGWRKGNSRNFHKVAEYLAEQNYVTVSISYRLSGEAPFQVQIQDCKAAVR